MNFVARARPLLTAQAAPYAPPARLTAATAVRAFAGAQTTVTARAGSTTYH
ncbi:hypothetical protein JIX56_08010 [Streptomyces sp. CA-210063]|uniref:hypothetical protein n=1 Tax=Streptomyces sp. CA-210063 TaxID=2801029 RepID=UPI00214B37CF|nr:hypothetical protein [Streptomyces sp. CA-210063]UUU29833.1 hypothetical protein JIX56_08010 [Streptomyces sp. CA-210063]